MKSVNLSSVFMARSLALACAICLLTGPTVRAEREAAVSVDLRDLIRPGATSVLYLPGETEKQNTSATAAREVYRSALLKPLRKEIRRGGAAAGVGRDPTKAGRRGQYLLATYWSPGGKKGKEVRLLIYEHRDAAEAHERMVHPAVPANTGFQAVRADLGKHSILRLQYFRQERVEIKAKGRAKKEIRRRERDASNSLLRRDHASRESAPQATRRTKTEQLAYIDDRIAIHTTGGDGFLASVLARLDRGRVNPAPKRSGLQTGAEPDIFFSADLRQNEEKRELEEKLLGLGLDARALGLGEIQSLRGGIRFLPDRFELDVEFQIARSPIGIGKLLLMNDPQKGPQRDLDEGFAMRADAPAEGEVRLLAPAALPPDIVGYSVFAGDMAAIWREFYRMLGASSPAALELADLYLRVPDGTSYDRARPYLTDYFGSRWISFARVPTMQKDTKHEPSPEPTVLVSIHDAPALDRFLRGWFPRVASALGLQPERYVHEGRTFYHLRDAEEAGGGLDLLGPLGYVCLTEEWLILSSRREHIDAAIRALENPRNFSTDPAFIVPLPVVARGPLWHARAALPPGRFYEACAVGGGLDSVLASPIHQIFDRALSSAAASMIDLESLQSKDAWESGFGPAAVGLYREQGRVKTRFIAFYDED